MAMLLAAAVVWSPPTCSGQKLALPADIGKAKSVAVLVRIVSTHRTKAALAEKQSNAEQEIKGHGWFELVDDPNRADLVCVIIETSRIRERIPFSRRVDYFMPETLVVFRGGAGQDWNAMPIWMDERMTFNGSGIGPLFDHFHSDVRHAESKPSQLAGNPGPGEECQGRWKIRPAWRKETCWKRC